ncbi:9341_t:CDS:2, partial [Acaulospora morrowiae]
IQMSSFFASSVSLDFFDSVSDFSTRDVLLGIMRKKHMRSQEVKSIQNVNMNVILACEKNTLKRKVLFCWILAHSYGEVLRWFILAQAIAQLRLLTLKVFLFLYLGFDRWCSGAQQRHQCSCNYYCN